jgi:hypothetical protein
MEQRICRSCGETMRDAAKFVPRNPNVCALCDESSERMWEGETQEILTTPAAAIFLPHEGIQLSPSGGPFSQPNK